MDEQKISSLINGYIDETLDEDQLHELQRWICVNKTNAKRFAAYIHLHNQIHAETGTQSLPFSTTDGSPPVVAQNEPASAFSFLRPPIYLAAIAAMLLIAMVGTALYLRPSGTSQSAASTKQSKTIEQPFVRVAQMNAAVFESDFAVVENQALGRSTISLKSGLVRLVFDDGVEVALQGPAKYTLIEPGRTRLESGMLAATVPPGAEGFTVQTPSGDVIDLGTAFAIEMDSTGNSRVSVFEGEVEVQSGNQNQMKRVTQGMAVKLAAGKIEPIEFESDRFDKVWPVSSGIVGSTGDFQFAPAWRPLRMIQSNSKIFVVPEKQAVQLQQPLIIDIESPGSVAQMSELSNSKLAAGIRVKSFLLQFNPVTSGPGMRLGPGKRQRPGPAGPGRPTNRPDPGSRKFPRPQNVIGPNGPGKLGRGTIKKIFGEITFDQPVLGLIVTEKQLDQSDSVFMRRRKQMPLTRRGLELCEGMIGDVISLSEDRRTVTLKLNAIEQLTDQVRVIVDDSLPNFKKKN